MSEYFFGGLKEGGGFSDESERKGRGFHRSFVNETKNLQVTASSGHLRLLSVCRICFRDFQTRFLFPFGLLDNESTLKTGCGSSSISF